ncbi:hypothetical protein GUJ93_ZPchr0012g21073 [Zizania palustris]|uniref:Uncharacterized protein n=1 Tax=Zizania palustris TaxID=103762 RepID=A0A8J6BQD4_ZIZPA|nr:hypothetical protein GUJ93_ZPchr0012g21073 [Zizania palustris]
MDVKLVVGFLTFLPFARLRLVCCFLLSRGPTPSQISPRSPFPPPRRRRRLRGGVLTASPARRSVPAGGGCSFSVTPWSRRGRGRGSTEWFLEPPPLPPLLDGSSPAAVGIRAGLPRVPA